MRHIPVLLDEVITGLNLKSGINAIDCTLGDGGHSEKILEKILPDGKLLGIDADPESLLQAKQYLYKFQDNFKGVRDNFVNLKKIVEDNQFKSIKAVIMDLGWSSPQFADRGRGFSFQNLNEPLDMRFKGGLINSNEKIQTASDILNNYSESDLERIFRKYGEDTYSRQLAEIIIEKRKSGEIKKVGDLVDIILSVKKYKGSKINPATKVFQALRIEINDELEVLKQALPQAIEVLEKGGRLAVITFHSLEDRIVKQYFKKQSLLKKLTIINKKPIIASGGELKQNPKARSAKLRIIEKV